MQREVERQKAESAEQRQGTLRNYSRTRQFLLWRFYSIELTWRRIRIPVSELSNPIQQFNLAGIKPIHAVGRFLQHDGFRAIAGKLDAKAFRFEAEASTRPKLDCWRQHLLQAPAQHVQIYLCSRKRSEPLVLMNDPAVPILLVRATFGIRPIGNPKIET